MVETRIEARIDSPASMTSFPVRALLLGERLDTRGLERDDTIATNPLTLRIGQDGFAFLFRYGVAVFAGLSVIEEDQVVRSLRPRIVDPAATPETDQVQILVKPGGEDQVDPSGGIALREASPERLQIVANVRSKSLILSHYESRIAEAFDRIDPLAAPLHPTPPPPPHANPLLPHITRA